MDFGTRPITNAAVSHGTFGLAMRAARRMPSSTGLRPSALAIPTSSGMGLRAYPQAVVPQAWSTR